MPTTANARRVGVGCVLAWCCFPVGAVIIVCFNASGEAAFSPEATAPAAQRRARPQAGAGGAAPADEAPGRTTAPGRSAGRANRRAARTAQGTTEEGPPAQRSEAGGPGRSRRRTQQNDLVLLGWCPSNPTRTFVLLGIEPPHFQIRPIFVKSAENRKCWVENLGGYYDTPPWVLCALCSKRLDLV